jgi:nitrite reductase (NADH) small subunit
LNRHRVASVTEIPPGEGREFVVEGRIVAVFHTDEAFHAMDGICPHAGGPLANGSLNGNVVTCPWHGWQFDVTSGRHCLNAHLAHPSFRVDVIDGELWVELPDA